MSVINLRLSWNILCLKGIKGKWNSIMNLLKFAFNTTQNYIRCNLNSICLYLSFYDYIY